jgi:hypothetical protein
LRCICSRSASDKLGTTGSRTVTPSPSRLARHGHIAAHDARQLSADGKAQAGAAIARIGDKIRHAEWTKLDEAEVLLDDRD